MAELCQQWLIRCRGVESPERSEFLYNKPKDFKFYRLQVLRQKVNQRNFLATSELFARYSKKHETSKHLHITKSMVRLRDS